MTCLRKKKLILSPNDGLTNQQVYNMLKIFSRKSPLKIIDLPMAYLGSYS